MPSYDLSHLNQSATQSEIGPIQDDEALFLYALIRGKRMKNVLELGGLQGYSARNFLRAVGERGFVYTVDLNPVPKFAPNHITIQKDAVNLTRNDVGNEPLDLVFFDCHIYEAQMTMYMKLCEYRVISDETVLALHDTNLHPRQFLPWAYPIQGGWVHQSVERKMVNDFHRMGYDAFTLHTRQSQHDDEFPMRHGLTIMQKFRELAC